MNTLSVGGLRQMFRASSITRLVRQLHPIVPRASARPMFSRAAPLFIGSLVSFMAFSALRKPIFNDVAISQPQVSIPQPKIHHSRFGGKLDYQELSIGSVTGLFLGLIVGKLSSAIVFLSLSTYFLLQFLESRNIITIPWNQIVQIGSSRINVKELFLHKPSFKISFVLTFLIAAYNI